jgi:hypothetical protein
MSNALATIATQVASNLGLNIQSDELISTLKTTAFRGAPNITDSQMVAMMILSRFVSIGENGCWNWNGASTENGYGVLTHKGKRQLAHRFSFKNLVEPIKDGLLVCHHCDNPSCVNPSHLYQGTHKDNRADTLNRKRWKHPFRERQHCSKGHNYEEVGFYFSKSDNSRVCRKCQRDAKRCQRQKLKGV